MHALACMIEEDYRDKTWHDYTATMQGMTAQMMARFSGYDWTAPSYIEMVYPETQDTRSAKEIKDHVLSLLN
jgi:hypothetical protein